MNSNIFNIFKSACVSLMAAAFMIHGSAAFAGDVPDSLKGTTVVDAAKAKSLIDSGVLAVDARVANEYAESHIKGAISIPYKEKSAKSVEFRCEPGQHRPEQTSRG